jgi:hypothetical protein
VRAVPACLAAFVALTASAHAASYEYLTTYVGVYDFSQKFVAQPGAPDGYTSGQHYGWASYDYDKVTAHRDGSFTAKHTRYIAAGGHLKRVDVQGSGLPGGPFTTTDDCGISSALTPYVTDLRGSNVQPIPVSRNPDIGVGWNLPDYGSHPTNEAPPFTVTGSMGDGSRCADAFHSHFLLWDVSTGGNTVFTQLPVTQKMRDAFSGATYIKYDQISGGRVWRRPFRNNVIKNSASSPGFQGDATETAEVKVDSEVTFRRVDGKTGVDKIGALLLNEGFPSGQGPDGGPAGTSGDDEEVLVPGMGTGEFSLGVQSTVVGGPRARPRAAATTLLSSGRAKVAGTSRPVRVKLVPTAAGRALLRAPHPEISARYVLRFKPRGSKRTLSATKAITIPARV